MIYMGKRHERSGLLIAKVRAFDYDGSGEMIGHLAKVRAFDSVVYPVDIQHKPLILKVIDASISLISASKGQVF